MAPTSDKRSGKRPLDSAPAIESAGADVQDPSHVRKDSSAVDASNKRHMRDVVREAVARKTPRTEERALMLVSESPGVAGVTGDQE